MPLSYGAQLQQISHDTTCDGQVSDRDPDQAPVALFHPDTPVSRGSFAHGGGVTAPAEGIATSSPAGRRSPAPQAGKPSSKRRRAIFAAVLVAQVATVLAMVTVSGRLTERAETAHADDLLKAAAEESADLLETHVAPAERAVTIFSRLAGSDPDASLMSYDDAFLETLRTTPQLSGLFIGTPEGGFSFVSRIDEGYRLKTTDIDDGDRTTQLEFVDADGVPTRSELDPGDSFDPTVRPWYELAIESPNEVVWTDPYVFFTSQRLGITVARTIERDGETIGVIGADIELGSLSEFLAALRVGENGGTFITDDDGVVIAHPDAALIQRPDGDGFRTVNISEIDDPLAQAVFASKRDQADPNSAITIFEDPELGRFHEADRTVPIGSATWSISVFGPRGDLVSDLSNARSDERWLAASIGILTMLLFGLIAWKVTRPVAALEVQATADELMLERIGRVIETSHNEIYLFDVETLRFSLVNNAARTNLGYTMEQLTTLTPVDVSFELDDDSLAEMIEPLRTGELDVAMFELVVQRSDGTTYPADVDLQLYSTEDPPVFVAIIQDTTERTAAQQHLHFQQALLSSQSEASLDGILAISADGSWLNYNQRFLDIWGIDETVALAATAGTAMAHEMSHVSDPDLFGAFVDDLRARPADSGTADFELINGTMLEIHGAPIMARDGSTYGRLWQYRDITDRKLQETALEDHRDTLESLVAIRTAELSSTNERLENEVSERRLLEVELKRQAHHDRLTGLPNRVHLERQFPEVLVDGERVALVFMDLNGFKYVNDTLGHRAGDQLLLHVGERLQQIVRPSDTLVRLGGDEFALLITNATEAACELVLERIRQVFVEPYLLDDHPFHIGMSIGVAYSAVDDFGDLLRRADLAMYRSKESGADVSFYDEDDDRRIQEWSWHERQLRQSIDEQQLEVLYQPILAIQTGSMVKAEALLRWHHPQRGLVMPIDFIPVAEETGFIVSIDRWVVAAAVADAAETGFTVSVNVAPRTLLSPDFVAYVQTCITSAGLPAQRLHLEVTERALAHPDTTLPVLRALREIGVDVGIDDFGTGYSSLTYLQHYPLNTLKLDQGFMDRLGRDDKANAIAEAVIRFAHSLSLTVIAEGVETERQLDWLREQACDEAQGYLFAEPLVLPDLAGFIAAEQQRAHELVEPSI